MTLPPPVRIGVLICGSFAESIEVVYGSYQDVYTHYLKATAPTNVQVDIDSYYIKKMEFPNEDCISEYDLFVITGSAADAYDDSIEWLRKLLSFLKSVIRNHPKVKWFGICFGHQLICRVFGGQCVPSTGQWEIGPTPIDLTDTGKSIFGVDRLSIQQMHRDHVPLESLEMQLASGNIHLLGHNDHTGNQGVVKFYPSLSDPDPESSPKVINSHQDIQILTVQGHPEFSEGIITAVAKIRTRDGIMDIATVTEYWGERGGDYEDEPDEKQGTGRRWHQTHGFDLIATALWKMLGVIPTEELTAESHLSKHPKATVQEV
ncbi:Putative glutamine amidotransferase-like protein C13C5.04 [Leucoagaricus sp. SymC.cos]|nr:Putative glutamine amidotransferase-like protein C13C5.04 [Leucoagaricus sp. SymC.cos]